MQVAITGGTGFIGKHLVQAHLDRGDQVRVLTRNPDLQRNEIEYVVGDLTQSDLSSFVGGADILYHCAGQLNDESQMHALHVDATQRLLEAAKGRVGRWIQLSSVGVYKRIGSGSITEDSEIGPVGVYEKTKTESDQLLVKFSKENDLDYCVLRPSNVFGPTMTNQSLAALVNLIKKGWYFHIGKKEALVNYVSVDDVVTALMACATGPKASREIYNLSQSTKTTDMIASLARGAGAKEPSLKLPEIPLRLFTRLLEKLPLFPLSIDRINALTNHTFFDSQKIQDELDFTYHQKLSASLADYARSL